MHCVGCSDPAKATCLAAWLPYIACLSTSSEARLLAEGQAAPPGCAVAIVDEKTTLHMLLKGGLRLLGELGGCEALCGTFEGLHGL